MRNYISILICFLLISCFIEPKKEKSNKIKNEPKTVITPNYDNELTIKKFQDLYYFEEYFNKWCEKNNFKLKRKRLDEITYFKDDKIYLTRIKNYKIQYTELNSQIIENIYKKIESEGYQLISHTLPKKDSIPEDGGFVPFIPGDKNETFTFSNNKSFKFIFTKTNGKTFDNLSVYSE